MKSSGKPHGWQPKITECCIPEDKIYYALESVTKIFNIHQNLIRTRVNGVHPSHQGTSGRCAHRQDVVILQNNSTVGEGVDIWGTYLVRTVKTDIVPPLQNFQKNYTKMSVLGSDKFCFDWSSKKFFSCFMRILGKYLHSHVFPTGKMIEKQFGRNFYSENVYKMLRKLWTIMEEVYLLTWFMKVIE